MNDIFALVAPSRDPTYVDTILNFYLSAFLFCDTSLKSGNPQTHFPYPPFPLL